MKLHMPYYKSIKSLFSDNSIHSMTHITGGGIEGNLSRILPNGLCAEIYFEGGESDIMGEEEKCD